LGVEKKMDTSTRAPESSTLSISTIAEDLTITGNVTSKGELHLHGQVQGDIRCVSLVLGEKAQLEGNVVAQDVIVRGRLIGSVRALTVTLEANSHVEADLFHKSLSLEQGTHFDGDSTLGGSASSSEVFSRIATEPKGSESVERHERVNGFVRTLGESLSA
jgi:cytoskeletal protein CcmA (bactofilin family)